MTSPDDSPYSRLVRDLRERLGEDCSTFAARFGLESHDVQRIESGDVDFGSWNADFWKHIASLCYEFLPGRLVGPGMPCSQCGSPVEYFERGLSAGLTCPVCGCCNGVWTNANHPRYTDDSLYDVRD